MSSLTLSELCSHIASVLHTTFDTSYWVRAEIASISSKGGHGYLELIEKSDGSLTPTARMRATCWASIYTMLSAYFEQETGSRLQVGMQVLVEVEVNFHAAYGLSLNIINIDPTFTVGDLARQRAETIRRLSEEGVIEMQRQLRLPTLVSRLAVISAESAAGYGDFCRQLSEGGYRFRTTLYPAIMQGEHADSSILAALDAIAAVEEEYDAVVIIRGGGSTTDLTCFDSYRLCSAAAQFPLPILTGIGHTRDVSVLDMVAHLTLKTPTAVAAFLVDRMAGHAQRLNELRRRLAQTAERQILIRRHVLDLYRQRITACNPERIYARGYSLLTRDGVVIRSTADVHPGDQLTTHLANGTITSLAQ